MTNLVAWLRLQLDGDERLAVLAGGGQWRVDCEKRDEEHLASADPVCTGRRCRIEGTGTPGITIYDEGGRDEDQADHIARHDPARVLAEVAAKRAILSLHDPGNTTSDRGWCVGCLEPGNMTYVTSRCPASTFAYSRPRTQAGRVTATSGVRAV